MTTRTLLTTVAVAWVIALAGLVWMMILGGMHPHHVPSLLIDLGIVSKACVVLSVVSATIGVIGVLARSRPGVIAGVGGAVGWGVLGALYGLAAAQSGLIDMNPPIPFAVYAPSYAEAIAVLLIGLTGAVVCLGLLNLRRPR